MDSLFILQTVCCTITAMLTLQLAMASLRVRWKLRRYEVSRWLLCGGMMLFAVHYLLQMTQGFRARGSDVGALFNILFYTPAAFLITISIINMESTAAQVRRYSLRSAAAYVLILAVFAFGVATTRSFHLGSLLYVMLAFFVASIAYFIFASRREIAKRKKRLLQESGADLRPYVRFSQASLMLLYVAAAFLPVAILFNTLLLYVGPLMLFALVFFVHSFISLGYYITPEVPEAEEAEDAEEVENTEDAENTELADCANADAEAAAGGACRATALCESGHGEAAPGVDAVSCESALGVDATPGVDVAPVPPLVSTARLAEIGQALKKWCDERQYRESSVTIYTLAAQLGCKKGELTEYFNQSAHTNFRTWLSDIRFNEAVRMMRSCPSYSNDAISAECGFSSHTQIYRVFKQKTGLSPSQWRDRLRSS